MLVAMANRMAAKGKRVVAGIVRTLVAGTLLSHYLTAFPGMYLIIIGVEWLVKASKRSSGIGKAFCAVILG